MPQLIRIGNRIINLLHVRRIEIAGENLVNVFMDDDVQHQFIEDEARALNSLLSDSRYVRDCPVKPPEFGVLSV